MGTTQQTPHRIKLPPALDKRLREAATAANMTPRALFLQLIRRGLFPRKV